MAKLGEIWFLKIHYETNGTDGFYVMYLVQDAWVIPVYSCQKTILAVILCYNT